MGTPDRSGRLLYHAGSFAALESALWREMHAVRSAEPLAPVVVLVPTNLLRRHLLLEGAARGGCINVHFLTLLDLARELGEAPLAAAGRSALPPLGGELVARAACAEMPATYFAAIADCPGFHRALLATIEDFKEAGHTPADLGRCLAGPAHIGAQAAEKLRDLAALWEAIERRLADLGLYDPADLMAEAATAAPTDRWLAGAAAVFVYGFYDLNELQRRLVAACAEARPATVFFPCEPGSPAFAYATPTFEWFLGRGFAPSPLPEADAPAELAALRSNLFAQPSGRQAAEVQGRLRIVSAPDEVREVRAIVGQALDAARRGTPLPRVAVLLRHTATYAPLFADECASGGLAAYHHDPPPLATTRAGRSLLMLLRLLGSDLARPDVMDFLTYADLAAGDAAATSDWDLLSLRAGIVKGRDQWKRRLAAQRQALEALAEAHDAAGGDDDESPERAAELLAALGQLEAVLAQLVGALDAVPAAGTWGEMVDAVLAAFRTLVRPSDEREAVAEAVAELRALDLTGERADTATLARFAREALEARRPRRPQFGSRGPVVADLMESRGLPFDVVCLPGLVEKGFPAPAPQDPLLSDRERESLNRAGLRLPLKRERAAEERLLLRLALGAADQAVVLTYPRIEPKSQRERVPSYFLLRVVEAVTGRRCTYDALAKFAGHEAIAASALAPDAPEAAWREADYDLAVASAAVRAGRADELACFAALSPTFASARLAEERRWGEAAFTPYDGVLSRREALDALAALLGEPPWKLPPTALEEYARCPFRYFLRRVLRIEPLEEPEAARRVSPRDKGRLFHAILHRALREARDRGELPLRPDADAELLGVAREELDAFERLGLVGLPALWNLERRAIERDLRRFVLDEADDTSGYVPARLEVRFGTKRGAGDIVSEQGVKVELPNGQDIELVGRIDRVDLAPEGDRARIIDYKTGSSPRTKKDPLGRGTALQLPLYLKAAEQLLGGPTVEMAMYRYVTARGDYGSWTLTRDEYAAHEDRLLRILATIIEGIGGGRFFAGTPAKGECRECDCRDVCGTAAEAAARRKLADEVVQAYLAMREAE